MAAIGKVLIQDTQIAASATTYYTAGAGVQTRIDKFTVTNPTATARTVTIYLLPSGGTASDADVVISARGINAGETYTCPEVVGQWLNSGGFIQALASAATALSLRASGVEVT
jgi:hypothetical protein